MQALDQEASQKVQGLGLRQKELESFFGRFPDVPKEVIIKDDVVRLGMRFSQSAVEAASTSLVKSYALFSYDMVQLNEMGEKQGLRVPEEMKLKGGLYGLRPTVVRVRLSSNSPYLIDLLEGKLMLLEDGTALTEVEYPPLPEYYYKKFDDGTLYYEVVPKALWGHMAYIVPFRLCQFWGPKEQCKYCDINENSRQLKKAGRSAMATAVKRIDQVVEVMKAISKEEDPQHRMISFLITGGTILKKLNGKSEDEFYVDYVRAVREAIGYRWPCQVTVAARPKESLQRYREAGVSGYQPNIEVWDKRLFEFLCPGKSRVVGRDQWIKYVLESVDVFGEGNVYPTFVTGVEMAQPWGFKTVDAAVKSTVEGWDFLMAHGAVPKPNQWCIEPGSALKGQFIPPLEYFVRTDQAWYEIWKKYTLPPIVGMGPMGPGRAIYPNSGFTDMGS